MSTRSLPARRKASRPESWPVVWRVTMPAVRPGDSDWHWYDGPDESEARRKCTSLRRLGWPVRLERIEQQPLMPSGADRVEMMRAQHERQQQSTPAH